MPAPPTRLQAAACSHRSRINVPNTLLVILLPEPSKQAKGNIDAVIALQGAIKFNGGGHVNHSIFWQNLCPVSYVGSTQIPDESDRQLLPGSLITPSHVYTSGKAVVCFNKAR